MPQRSGDPSGGSIDVLAKDAALVTSKAPCNHGVSRQVPSSSSTISENHIDVGLVDQSLTEESLHVFFPGQADLSIDVSSHVHDTVAINNGEDDSCFDDSQVDSVTGSSMSDVIGSSGPREESCGDMGARPAVEIVGSFLRHEQANDGVVPSISTI
ncbi:hypothetical protein V6N12_037182 [Hibiscus sabdariffa]|uniref:Uncharacterized protein n=1 Tax=Hibiscus sabdariffa TaxID=183260 RepID=A0ABR2ARV0_9ROSI